MPKKKKTKKVKKIKKVKKSKLKVSPKITEKKKYFTWARRKTRN